MPSNETPIENPVIAFSINANQVQTMPLDTTLTQSGTAADAKAVGDALALKADKDELLDTITVNSQSADATGNILVNADDVPYGDGSDVAEAIAGLESEAERLDAKDATDILMDKTAEDPQTVAAEIGAAEDRITALEARTATGILMEDGSEVTVAQKIATIDASIDAVDEKTGSDIDLDSTGAQTVAEAISALNGGKVGTADIADNLTTADASKVLSAAQGVALKQLVDGKAGTDTVNITGALRSLPVWTSGGMTMLQLIAALPASCMLQAYTDGQTPYEITDFDERMDKAGTLVIHKSGQSYAGAIFFPKRVSDAFWYYIMAAADQGKWYRHSLMDSGYVLTVNETAADESGNVDLGYISDEDIDALFDGGDE